MGAGAQEPLGNVQEEHDVLCSRAAGCRHLQVGKGVHLFQTQTKIPVLVCVLTSRMHSRGKGVTDACPARDTPCDWPPSVPMPPCVRNVRAPHAPSW